MTGPSRVQLGAGMRYLLITGTAVGAAGVAGHWLAWPLLTSTIGPTAYMFAAHPGEETARVRNAAIGHGVGIGVGLCALAAFGLLHRPRIASTSGPTWAQLAAAAGAAGVTVLLLELAGSHHAPAAATALLVATGLARPGAPLIGLVLGLALVLVVGSTLTRLPMLREAPGAGRSVTTTGARR